MAMSPCNAWKMPTMIITMAANMMNPTAQPLVFRPAGGGQAQTPVRQRQPAWAALHDQRWRPW
jgi:hypothetical protein